MTTLDALKKTRRLIVVGWCQGSDAQDCHGEPCLPIDAGATNWCLTGAANKATWPTDNAAQQAELDELWDSCEDAVKTLGSILGFYGDKKNVRECLQEWNDEEVRSQTQVLNLCDYAIRLCEERREASDPS